MSTNTYDEHPLVADIDPQELISVVKFDIRKGTAPEHDTITHAISYDIVFLSKYQSHFRKAKSKNEHPFRLFKTFNESFNRGELVIANSFLDIRKAFDYVWHNAWTEVQNFPAWCTYKVK